MFNVYGVKYDAHRAVWMGKNDVINLIEQPGEQTGENGGTQVIAETVAEYNREVRAPKAANPLQ